MRKNKGDVRSRPDATNIPMSWSPRRARVRPARRVNRSPSHLYLVISSSERRVERYARPPGGAWILHDFAGKTGSIRLESLARDLGMARIHHKVLCGAETRPEP